MTYDPTSMENAARRCFHINNLLLIPVLFANGVDDDLPALRAIVGNRHIMFDGKIYAPNEKVTVTGRTLSFSCGAIVVHHNGKFQSMEPDSGPKPGSTIVTLHQPFPGRALSITKARYLFNQPVQP